MRADMLTIWRCVSPSIPDHIYRYGPVWTATGMGTGFMVGSRVVVGRCVGATEGKFEGEPEGNIEGKAEGKEEGDEKGVGTLISSDSANPNVSKVPGVLASRALLRPLAELSPFSTLETTAATSGARRL